MEGEVVLIRPLSITLLSGLALLLAIAGTAVLLLIRVPDTRSIPVTISTRGDHRISFTVPQRLAAGLAVGDHVSIFAPSSSVEPRKRDITILEVRISAAATGGFGSSSDALITAAVPESEPPFSGVRATADVPAGSRSLFHWLLHREGE